MARQKVVLITGASSGFGREAAVRLAGRGHRVFGTSRQARVDEGGVRMVALDVRDDASVRIAVEAVLAEAGRIDVLVNNAGYVLGGLAEEVTIEEVRQQFETNFFGLVRMTKAVLPGMRRQRSGTIVNVGSLAGLMGVPGESYYSATKFAIEGYSEALRYEVEPFGVRVSLVEPSYFKTGIDTGKVEGSERIGDYDGMRERIARVFEAGLRQGGDPREVGELLVRIAESDRPRLRYLVGREARWLGPLRRVLPDAVLAWGTRRYFKIPRVIGKPGRT